MITKEFCDEWDGVGLNVKDMIEHFMDSESMFLKYLYKFLPPPLSARTISRCFSRRMRSRVLPETSG